MRRLRRDRPTGSCVDAPGAALTYAEVDARANQLARHLLVRGIGSGDRVALLFDDPVQAYVAMLAVLKAGAAYVPLDPGFPADRIAYIVVGRRGDGRAVAVAPARRTWRRCGRRSSPSTTWPGASARRAVPG